MRYTMKFPIRTAVALIILPFLLSACVSMPPAGPSAMSLPGAGKLQADFMRDDAACRNLALVRAGSPAEAAQQSQAASTILGILFGAGLGAAVGVIGGDPGLGAAVGAGVGAIGGIGTGTAAGSASAMAVQQRYDAEYYQCMYVAGHQVPGVAAPRQPAPQYAPPPPPSAGYQPSAPSSGPPPGSLAAPPPFSPPGATACQPTGKYVKTPQGLVPECQ